MVSSLLWLASPLVGLLFPVLMQQLEDRVLTRSAARQPAPTLQDSDTVYASRTADPRTRT